MGWRTPTVVALCDGIRETEDYSALPILADAVEEGGCHDGELLKALRTPQGTLAGQRLVALVYSDETAEAVRAIERLAEEMGPRAFCEEGDGYGEPRPTDYFRLMRVGNRWVAELGCEYRWGGTVEYGSEGLRDGEFGNFNEFWSAYELITGTHVDPVNPFGCTC